MILNTALVIELWLLGMSICVDMISLDRRQDRWEKAHPGQVYVRRFRRL